MESESTKGDVDVEGYTPENEGKSATAYQERHLPTFFNITRAPFRANLTRFCNSLHKYSWEPVSSSILVFGGANVKLEGSDFFQIDYVYHIFGGFRFKFC